MQKTIGILSVLLAAQLALALGVSLTGPALTAHRPNTPLIDLSGPAVDRITVEGPEGKAVILERSGEGWTLPGTGDFPADAGKVDRLLQQLRNLKRGLAVATTEGAQKRFKVSDDTFERRLTLARGDENLAALYLGTSPGVRQVHVRTAGDEAVYTAELGLYDAPVRPEDWEDKGVLQLPLEEIESIVLPDLTLTRSPRQGDTPPEETETGTDRPSAAGDWTADRLNEGESLNQANAAGLAQKLATLVVGSVLGRESKPEYGLAPPVLIVRVERRGGETIEYRFGKREQENDYSLKVSNRPEYFRLASFTAQPLIEGASRERLLQPPSAAAASGTGAQDTDAPQPPTEPSEGQDAQDGEGSGGGASS